MASTYSPALRLELMATGDQSGTWGVTTNTNLGALLEQAVTGVLSVAQGDVANLTLSALNGASDQARNAVVILTGPMTAARNVVVPAAPKLYVVKNSTTGGFALTVKTPSGSGVAIANGTSQLVYCDGTNVVGALVNAVSGTLPVASGGTGLTNGVSGGILGFTSTGLLASSGVLANNALLLGGGAGATPKSLTTGATTDVLHGGSPPSWGAITAASISGILATANGGTGRSTLGAGVPSFLGGFVFSGQAGQPSWLIGSNDGSNFFVWNPANFNVASAASGQPIPTSSSYPVGMTAMAVVVSGSVVNGGTIAASSLQPGAFAQNGNAGGTGSATMPGAWQNISGVTLSSSSGSRGGLFVRIS